MNGTDLRTELGAPPEPQFDMELPPGWSRRGVDDEALEVMLTGLKRRLMDEHKPQVYAELRSLVKESFQGMRRNGAFAFFSATDPEPGTLWIPASIIASTRRAEPGGTLDDLARTLIQSHGATALRGDKRTLRFERERNVRFGTETIVNQSVIYLIPMPGAKRRRALQLVAGFGRTLETPPDDPSIEGMKFLFDSCVSTLRWRAPQ